MELQQQGIPGYGLYRSHYGQQPGGQHDPAFRGPGSHLGGYPFPPMPGQTNGPYGYAHLGYPSSQSPGPREGEPEKNLNLKFIRNSIGILALESKS